MSRLIDLVLKDPVSPEDAADLRNAPHFDITNVAKYFYASSDQERWDYDKDFPNIIPPEPMIWMEFDAPFYTNSEGDRAKWSVTFGPERKRGALVIFQTPAEHQAWRMGMGGTEPLDGITEDHLGFVVFQIFADMGPEGLYEPAAAMALRVGSTGAPDKLEMIFSDDVPPMLRDQIAKANAVGGFPFAFALALMNCHNVAVVPATDPRTRQQRRRDERSGETATDDFLMLGIETMVSLFEREGKRSEVGLPRAMSIVKGHFATYTPENPMFGRLVGTFWRPSHVRGRD